MEQDKFIAEPTVVSLLDSRLGHGLVSVLRTPVGEIIVAITGQAKEYYDFADEDWHTMADRGYDIWSRTFGSEGEIAEYLREHTK